MVRFLQRHMEMASHQTWCGATVQGWLGGTAAGAKGLGARHTAGSEEPSSRVPVRRQVA